MKKNLGFTRFEFYFVISVIGIITTIALQRYLVLANETRLFSAEMMARNFTAVIYNYHASWIMMQQNTPNASLLSVDGVNIQFSEKGWPISALAEKKIVDEISISSCLSLWQHFLENPPLISFVKSDYGTQLYHLSLPNPDTCRYELVNSSSGEIFVDYKPGSGEVVVNKQPLISK